MKRVEFKIACEVPNTVNSEDGIRIIKQLTKESLLTDSEGLDLVNQLKGNGFDFRAKFYASVRSNTGLTFGDALEALKRGKSVTRRGWNGKHMFLWLKKGTRITSDMCHDERLRQISELNGGSIDGLPTICMKTADNKILTGWLASQSDMLATDWYVLSDKKIDFDVPKELSNDCEDCQQDQKVGELED